LLQYHLNRFSHAFEAMHFALPQRKSSARTPSAYAAKPQPFQVRKTKKSFVAIVAIGIFAILWLLYSLIHSSPLAGLASVALARGTQVVLVTCFRDPEDMALKEAIIANREDYAKRHGTSTDTALIL
jgi:hypothetical protein